MAGEREREKEREKERGNERDKERDGMRDGEESPTQKKRAMRVRFPFSGIALPSWGHS